MVEPKTTLELRGSIDLPSGKVQSAKDDFSNRSVCSPIGIRILAVYERVAHYSHGSRWYVLCSLHIQSDRKSQRFDRIVLEMTMIFSMGVATKVTAPVLEQMVASAINSQGVLHDHFLRLGNPRNSVFSRCCPLGCLPGQGNHPKTETSKSRVSIRS